MGLTTLTPASSSAERARARGLFYSLSTKGKTMFKLSIKMDNAAFSDGNSGSEVARILRELATRIDHDDVTQRGFSMTLTDINGNKVGEAKN